MKSPSILVLNSGSSSLKFAIIDPTSKRTIVSGLGDRIGQQSAEIKVKFEGGESTVHSCPQADHREALHRVLKLIEKATSASPLTGIGHRVVHGGEFFRESVRITGHVLAKINECNHLAPLHNPANVTGIEAMSEQLPDLPQVAVFDTAFHQSLPAKAFTYALPYSLYKKHGLRRYGFHVTSHRYVTLQAAKLLNTDINQLNLVTAHLGNGCSAAAICQGQSVDTTMGLTPLEGLVMGTRSGDVDPGLLLHLNKSLNYSTDDLNTLLNKESGLLGISESSNDMRTLLEEEANGNQRASLAIEVFCYRLAKTIAALGVPAYPLNALVFTGGIGENAAVIRERVCQQLGILGVKSDLVANKNHGKDQDGRISTADSDLQVLVIPTNEELLIAMDTQEIIAAN